MSGDLRGRLSQMTTAELLEIVRKYDTGEWRVEVFPVAESILRERRVDPSELKDREAPVTAAEPVEPVEVMTVQNPALLPVVKSLLEEGGFTFAIKNEFTQGLFAWGQFGTGYNPITGPPTVLVEASRAEEARQLLEPLMRESGSDAHAPSPGEAPPQTDE